jgi:hypothetical protein
MNKGHSLLLCFIEQEKRGEKEGVGGGGDKARQMFSIVLVFVCVCMYLYEVGWYCLYFGSLLGLNHLLYILSHADFLMGD